MFGDPILDGQNEILVFGKGRKFGLIFHKYALKLIIIWKIIEKIREIDKSFQTFLIFWRNYREK